MAYVVVKKHIFERIFIVNKIWIYKLNESKFDVVLLLLYKMNKKYLWSVLLFHYWNIHFHMFIFLFEIETKWDGTGTSERIKRRGSVRWGEMDVDKRWCKGLYVYVCVRQLKPLACVEWEDRRVSIIKASKQCVNCSS
jgi:hypothetical protein